MASSTKKTSMLIKKNKLLITQPSIHRARTNIWQEAWGNLTSHISNRTRTKREMILTVVVFSRKDSQWYLLTKLINSTNTSSSCKCSSKSNMKWNRNRRVNCKIKCTQIPIITMQTNRSSMLRLWPFSSNSSQTRVSTSWYTMSSTWRNFRNNKVKGLPRGQRETRRDKCSRFKHRVKMTVEFKLSKTKENNNIMKTRENNNSNLKPKW